MCVFITSTVEDETSAGLGSSHLEYHMKSHEVLSLVYQQRSNPFHSQAASNSWIVILLRMRHLMSIHGFRE